MKKVMVFGVFDGLHEGHRAFLKQARALGDELIVVLTPDHIVQELKDHAPKLSFDNRKKVLEENHLATKILKGDDTNNEWNVLKEFPPDIIALGYDQRELGKALHMLIPTLSRRLVVIVLPSHMPEEYKSSILN